MTLWIRTSHLSRPFSHESNFKNNVWLFYAHNIFEINWKYHLFFFFKEMINWAKNKWLAQEHHSRKWQRHYSLTLWMHLTLTTSLTNLTLPTVSFYFFFLAMPRLACGILVSWPGIKPTPPAVEAQSHQMAREVPCPQFLDLSILKT